MTAFAFEAPETKLLYAVCLPGDAASVAVMKKLGMRFRGFEKWYGSDNMAYEITCDEWRERQAADKINQGLAASERGTLRL